METGNFQNFEEKKGFEIAYALFRLSTVIPHRDYQERLQKSALSVLEYSSVGSWDSLDRELSLIKKYLNIGEEMGMVNSMHSSVILGEIFKLHNAISGLGKVKELPDLDIAGIFSKDDESVASTEILDEVPQDFSPLIEQEEAGETKIADEDGEEMGGGGAKAAMRQSAILEKIRQTENCRIKDLEEILPDISERTLRYDLQELIGQGLIERVGTGGPSIFYRMRVFEI